MVHVVENALKAKKTPRKSAILSSIDTPCDRNGRKQADYIYNMTEKILARRSFLCKCGRTYESKTADIVVKSGALLDLPQLALQTVAAGHLGLVFTADVEAFALRAQSLLLHAGFRVTKYCFAADTAVSAEAVREITAAPSEIRLFIGVGADNVADILKAACFERACNFFAVLTAPCTDTVLLEDAGVLQCAVRTKLRGIAPQAVIADLDILSAAPKNLIAAGYGTLFSKYAALFDVKFWSLVSGGNSCAHFAAEVKQLLDNFFNGGGAGGNAAGAAVQDGGVTGLTETLLAVGLLQQMSGIVLHGAEHIFAGVLKEWTNHRLTDGENKFIASFTMLNFYAKLISFSGTDLCFPPCKAKDIQALNAAVNAPVASTFTSIGSGNLPSFWRADFMLNEYREDLAASLFEITQKLPQAARTFRRIYDDAGYFLKDFLPSCEIMRVMSLSAVMRDKYCYLNYLKDGGLLELPANY